MNKQKSEKLTASELEEITTTAFVREIQSHEYNEEYTPSRRAKVLKAFQCVVEILQKKK